MLSGKINELSMAMFNSHSWFTRTIDQEDQFQHAGIGTLTPKNMGGVQKWGGTPENDDL